MTNDLNLEDIVENNPRLDLNSLDKSLRVVEESKRLNIKPPGYRLATPMTPRHLPPVDHDNRMADIEHNQVR